MALLAGVSVDYYARLERGRLGGASPAVLDAVAGALRLDEAERLHLRDLASAAASPERAVRTLTAPPMTLRPSILALLAGMTEVPAYVRNQRSDILAANDLCLALYDGILRPGVTLNLARFIFSDARAQVFFRDWDQVADGAVGAMRIEAGRRPHDRDLAALVSELSAASGAFATRWAEQNVHLHRTALKRLRHSAIGDLDLTGDALDLPGEGLTLIAYTAEPGSAAAAKLAQLAALRPAFDPSPSA